MNTTKLASFVPLRLTAKDRLLLSTVHNALLVSEYTDNIDITSRRNKAMRILAEIEEACGVACGLGVCAGKKKLAQGEIRDNENFLASCFEVGRRNKILNPSKMRDTYGKMMYLLQDSLQMSVSKGLGFSLYKEIVTVKAFLCEVVGEELAQKILQSEEFENATKEVKEVDARSGERVPRDVVVEMVKRKREAKALAVEKFAGGGDKLSEEELLLAIDSMSDARTVIQQNVEPVERMLRLLETNFDERKPTDGFSLELNGGGGFGGGYGRSFNRFSFSGGFGGGGGGGGSGGAKLSHSHSTQYTFVRQTLNLWIEVQQHMHCLWLSADSDLLSTRGSYQLCNTGQGLNRVQSCPEVGHIMRALLNRVQKRVGGEWVGLSVIHLGDRDVPNALIFIDKYTQVPNILNPICDFIAEIPKLQADPKLNKYIVDNFGSGENLKLMVLIRGLLVSSLVFMD